MLAQNDGPGDPKLELRLGGFLGSHGYLYFANADHQAPHYPRVFASDGDHRLAFDSRFIDVLDPCQRWYGRPVACHGCDLT
jgi:hypothetical protein